MNKLSAKHFMFFILGTSIISLRSYSSIFIRLGGRDIGLVSAIASLVFIFFLIYLLKICIKTNTYDINEIFNGAFPRWLSTLFLFIFVIGLFLTSVESSSVEANSIHTNFFLSSPNWYCLLFFIVPAAIVLSKQLNTILIVVIVTVSLTLVGDIIILIFISKYLDFSFLFPVLGNGITSNIISSFILILGSLSSVAVVLPYLKFLVLDKKNALIKDSAISALIATALITLSFITSITLFGPERAGNIFYPEYVQSQRIQIASFFEFGELFYIFKSVCMWFIKYLLSSYAIILLLDKKIKSRPIFISIYSVIVFICSWYLVKNQFLLFEALEYLQPLLLITLGIIPLITFTVFALRKNHKKTENLDN